MTASFDGGQVSRDGGALLLRKALNATGTSSRLATCFSDERHPRYTEFSVEEFVRQRHRERRRQPDRDGFLPFFPETNRLRILGHLAPVDLSTGLGELWGDGQQPRRRQEGAPESSHRSHIPAPCSRNRFPEHRTRLFPAVRTSNFIRFIIDPNVVIW